MGQVKLLDVEKRVSDIDWKGVEGKKTITEIFESILDIISDEN